MGIFKYKDRREKEHYVVSKYWPQGSGRLRMYAPNQTAARKLLSRVETAILDGTWRQLKDELSGKVRDFTVSQFYERFLTDYCKVRMRSWERYQLSFVTLNRHLGDIPLQEFRRDQLHSYVAARVKEVTPATVNRDIAALRKMFSYAIECGLIDAHPLTKFPMLRERKKAFKPITLQQFRALVEAADPGIQAMLAIIGETGIRIEEAMSLEWIHVNFRRQLLIVELTKDNEPREIPLSDYAIGWLQGLIRYVHCPYVFVSPKTLTRWVNPYKPLERACKKVGIQIAFHDLRRFRCTQWLIAGVDVRTVQKLMGHSDIETTMRYAAYVSSHAVKSIREAQKAEEIEFAQEANRRQQK